MSSYFSRAPISSLSHVIFVRCYGTLSERTVVLAMIVIVVVVVVVGRIGVFSSSLECCKYLNTCET